MAWQGQHAQQQIRAAKTASAGRRVKRRQHARQAALPGYGRGMGRIQPAQLGWIAWLTWPPSGKWGRCGVGSGRGAWKGRIYPRGHASYWQGKIRRGCIRRGRLGMPTGSLRCQRDGLNAWSACRASGQRCAHKAGQNA